MHRTLRGTVRRPRTVSSSDEPVGALDRIGVRERCVLQLFRALVQSVAQMRQRPARCTLQHGSAPC